MRGQADLRQLVLIEIHEVPGNDRDDMRFGALARRDRSGSNVTILCIGLVNRGS